MTKTDASTHHNHPARALALYLPQFHPIKENNEWWGPGFTEWTNTAKARPLFKGHYQPHIPGELGYYDLRLEETRETQAQMARNAGIEGFCYYHYWFAGKQILERPFAEVLKSGQPDFPFCLCWANQSWTGIWHGAPNRILIEQTYPGREDDIAHFNMLLPAFQDKRYIRVDGKPLFFLYKPEDISRETLDLWRKLAVDSGLKGLHLVGVTSLLEWDAAQNGFDAKALFPLLRERPWISRKNPFQYLRQKMDINRGIPTTRDHREINLRYIEGLMNQISKKNLTVYACATHAFDNTPRSGVDGVVLTGSTPELYRDLVREIINMLSSVKSEHRIVLLKSWNEWAEGNHLEPDLKFGSSYLDALKSLLVH